MSEPTSSGYVMAAVAAVTLDVFGLDVKFILWAAIGAFIPLVYTKASVSRRRAFAQVVIGGLLGAVMGGAVADYLSVEKMVGRLAMCAIFGAGAYPIIQESINTIVRKIAGGGR